MLSATGLSYIEITSFVHPKWIPALSDALDVAKGINRKPGVTYAALIPNRKGWNGLSKEGSMKLLFHVGKRDTQPENINKSIGETLPVLKEVIGAAKQAGLTARAYLSTVFGCPYEHHVPLEQIIRTSETLFDMGINELSLGDTIGAANPVQVQRVLEVLLKRFPKRISPFIS
ncbi:hypothetical protein PO124_18585 [Bacillus licheniformis]|nr:hypothetical protein [Bacillus licheniformis]